MIGGLLKALGIDKEGSIYYTVEDLSKQNLLNALFLLYAEEIEEKGNRQTVTIAYLFRKVVGVDDVCFSDNRAQRLLKQNGKHRRR